jgi:hypothetical protein
MQTARTGVSTPQETQGQTHGSAPTKESDAPLPSLLLSGQAEDDGVIHLGA